MTKQTPFLSEAALSDALYLKVLNLILLPTEQCNFRCTYCYEDFEAGKMRPELVHSIKMLVDRRIADLQAISLSWFGGEPLVAKDIIFDIAEHVNLRCRETGVQNLGGHLTTNGYLLDIGTVERLCAVEQRSAQISLDGLGAAHDRSRPLASGKGSFGRIWDNLVAIHNSEHDFHVGLRVHVGAADLAETENLCREINRQFGGDPRFTFHFRLVSNWGGANKDSIHPMDEELGRATVKQLERLLTDIPNNCGQEDDVQYICYAAKPNTWLIRADGRVGRCTVALNDPRNTVGNLDERGFLRVDKEMLRPWMAGFKDIDSQLLSCPYTGVRKIALSEVAKPIAIIKSNHEALVYPMNQTPSASGA
ncbi:MAG: radical SAM protein [Nitrosomonadales bacterium]|nr:radical SAM protein [Nitrosomonadales bacterium]